MSLSIKDAMSSEINQDMERKMNALSVALLLSTQQGVRVPAPIGELIDHAGIMMLSHCKRTLGVSAEEMAQRLAKLSDDIEQEMRTTIRVPRT